MTMYSLWLPPFDVTASCLAGTAELKTERKEKKKEMVRVFFFFLVKKSFERL